MADVSPEAVAEARAALGVPEGRIPRSIAIIMDGNGRWARARGLPRSAGHEAGANVVRDTVSECARLGIEALALYSFSIENWHRPPNEVNMLMHLYADYFRRERQTVMEHNIRLRHLGRRDGLPPAVLREMDESLRASAGNTGMFLCLALNYGSRAEITDAIRRIARRVAAGELRPDDVTEEVLSDHLDTRGVPDPDLLIRTSGEMRLSNYLLWQVSYAEIHVTDAYWPDFSVAELHRAIRTFAGRHRRFGGLDDSNT